MTSELHSTGTLPRLGFLGVGWIGHKRLHAVAESGLAHIAAVAEPDPAMAAVARAQAPEAEHVGSLVGLLDVEQLDGVVIATPSALHVQQAVAALERGLAVFCQKPLACTAVETQRVIDAARAADRLLAVDMCYRYVRGVPELRELVRAGELGHVYAADLVFHNAYGPDKPWFREVRLSGGGCLIDLGIHLVDLALWVLGFPSVQCARGHLYAGGVRLPRPAATVEDYADATIELEGDTTIRFACSWNLPAGRDAVIDVRFYGTRAGAGLYNVAGSFYDFIVERYDGTRTTLLSRGPDAWGDRAITDWVRRLRAGHGFDPAVAQLMHSAVVVDAIYVR